MPPLPLGEQQGDYTVRWRPSDVVRDFPTALRFARNDRFSPVLQGRNELNLTIAGESEENASSCD